MASRLAIPLRCGLGRPGRRTPGNWAVGVSLWALLGVFWILFVGQAWTRWALSDDQFAPAPIFGPDTFSDSSLAVLRIIELVSLVIAAVTIWTFLIRPLWRQRQLTLDGMIVIGSLLAAGIDPMINYFHYTFAWNAHALNLGSWLAFFPLHQGPTRYAEGIAWFVPPVPLLGGDRAGGHRVQDHPCTAAAPPGG